MQKLSFDSRQFLLEGYKFRVKSISPIKERGIYLMKKREIAYIFYSLINKGILTDNKFPGKFSYKNCFFKIAIKGKKGIHEKDSTTRLQNEISSLIYIIERDINISYGKPLFFVEVFNYKNNLLLSSILFENYEDSIDMQKYIINNYGGEEEFTSLFSSLAIQLRTLHLNNMSHGDLIPSNLLLNPKTLSLTFIDFEYANTLNPNFSFDVKRFVSLLYFIQKVRERSHQFDLVKLFREQLKSYYEEAWDWSNDFEHNLSYVLV